ncbi:MAG: non-hydrolyzing UDP-N-acetylglucosamine 2-epimerase [Candidatus Asgardarchaeia archaeon]
MVVIGVRPQVIKAAPLIKVLDRDKEVDLLLVHSGQHYDYEMSKIFFNELDLPDPIKNLDVKGGTHAQQTAKIMLRLEEFLEEEKPDVVVVFGDANTTLASALAAVKSKIPVAHVEAGLRSWDMRMPEEINRVLTDHVSQVLYAPTEFAVSQLKNEGILDDLIVLSGDTMFDSILAHKEHIENSKILEDLGLEKESYIVVTAHRAENVDNSEKLRNIVDSLIELSKYATIVFPVHPRTLGRLKMFNLLTRLELSKIRLIKPVGYFEMLKLIKDAIAVLTDSGGIQKEAFILGTPCITMRERTEWIETIRLGGNTLVGTFKELIIERGLKILENYKQVKNQLRNLRSPYGEGNAANKILNDLKNRIRDERLKVDLLPTRIKEFLL